MRPSLNVFFASGKFFIQYFTVALTSLLENNKHIDLNVFLIYDFEDKSLLDIPVKLAKEKYGIDLQLIFQDSSIFDHYRIGDHVSKNTYLRLLIADIIPAHIDTGLFLDSDTVVTGPLDELSRLKFADIDRPASPQVSKYVYAVSEIEEQRIANSQRLSALGFKTDRYFNAGVMMVNLKAWREENITPQLMKLAEQYMEKLQFYDQDVLNIFFLNRWGELDRTYNALHLIWKRAGTPLIVHFAGASKPWNYLDRHPYKAWYFKYLKLTPYNEQKYTDFSYRRMPYKYYRDIRHFLNYFRQLLMGNLKQFK